MQVSSGHTIAAARWSSHDCLQLASRLQVGGGAADVGLAGGAAGEVACTAEEQASYAKKHAKARVMNECMKRTAPRSTVRLPVQ